jgi:hypothetical protein
VRSRGSPETRLPTAPLALLVDAGRLLPVAVRGVWPASVAVALAAAATGSVPAPLGFCLQAVTGTWLLALVSLVITEHAGGVRLGPVWAVRTLRGRLARLAALGLAIRTVTDALTPVGIGVLLSAGWAIALPVLAVEGPAVRAALRTSWAATRRSLLRIAAVRLIAVLIGVAATFLAAALIGRATGTLVAKLAAQAVLGPFPLVVQALLYVEGRSAGPAIRDFNSSIASIGVGSSPDPRAR